MFDRYLEIEWLLTSLQVVLVMVGMGATLSLADFASVLRRPRSLIVGCLCQFLLAPLLTALTISVCHLDDGIAIGLILIAAMPGGGIANLYTFLARGNVALSISLTVLATFASLLTVPLLLRIFASGLVPADVSIPIDAIVTDVLGYLIAPLIVGMFCARIAPLWSRHVAPWLIRLALLILVIIVIGSLGSGKIDPLSYGWGTPAVIVILCVAIQNISMAIFPLFRWPVADQTAIGIGVTIRNINLALLLASRLFPVSADSKEAHSLGGGVLYVILFWGALSLLVCFSSVFFQRRALAAEANTAALKAGTL